MKLLEAAGITALFIYPAQWVKGRELAENGEPI